MFLNQDARRQRVDGVVVMNGHWRLQHDGTAIELARHEVHGRAADVNAVLERLLLGVETREGRQKRRVDVHDPIGKRLEQRRADQPHEAGETDERDVSRAQLARERAIVVVARGKVARQHDERLDTGGLRACESGRLSAIRDDHGDLGVESSIGDGVADRLQIRAAPGNQHGEAPVVRRGRGHRGATSSGSGDATTRVLNRARYCWCRGESGARSCGPYG
jgi:hypothetical protein